jgi:hypothetical protein
VDDLNKAVTEAILVWRTLWKPPVEDNVVLAKSWVTRLQGVNVEKFRKAAQRICDLNTTWPKPAEILNLVRVEPCHRVWEEPPQLPVPPITADQRRQILSKLNPKLAGDLLEKDIGAKP